MPSVYINPRNIKYMYKDNNNKNQSIGPNNAQNGAEGNNNSFIYQMIIETHNSRTLTNSINPFIMNIEYIRHAYDLNIGVVMKFKSHPRRQS